MKLMFEKKNIIVSCLDTILLPGKCNKSFSVYQVIKKEMVSKNKTTQLNLINLLILKYICLTSLTCVKCGVRSTLCWEIGNISGSSELFCIVILDYGVKLHKLSIYTLVMLQK